MDRLSRRLLSLATAPASARAWCTAAGCAPISCCRTGSSIPNGDHVPPYATVNVGISHEIKQPDGKPVTVRFDVVNVFDTVYQIRNGSGVGVFAPQYGERRGYFVGISKKL